MRVLLLSSLVVRTWICSSPAASTSVCSRWFKLKISQIPHSVTPTAVVNNCRQLFCSLTFSWMKRTSRWMEGRWIYLSCCSHSSEIGCVDMKRVTDRFWSGVSVSLSGTQHFWRAVLSCSTCTVLTVCPQCVLCCQVFLSCCSIEKCFGHFFPRGHGRDVWPY